MIRVPAGHESCAAAAKRLGVSRQALHAWCHAHELSTEPRTPDAWDRLREGHSAPTPPYARQRAILRAFGRGANTVRALAHHMDAPLEATRAAVALACGNGFVRRIGRTARDGRSIVYNLTDAGAAELLRLQGEAR